jgi:hypothetical protein
VSKSFEANTLSLRLGNCNNRDSNRLIIGKVLALWFLVGVIDTVLVSAFMSTQRSFHASPLSAPVSLRSSSQVDILKLALLMSISISFSSGTNIGLSSLVNRGFIQVSPL